MSHRLASAFDDHFDHCFVVLNNVQQSTNGEKVLLLERRDQSLSDNFLSAWEVSTLFGFWDVCHNAVALRRVFPPVPMNVGVGECNTSKTESHKSRAVMPSMRKPASKDVTSGSVELCDTAVCF